MSNAEVITGIGPDWYAMIRQIRKTMQEMNLPRSGDAGRLAQQPFKMELENNVVRTFNKENLDTYLTAMLDRAFQAIPQMRFQGVEIICQAEAAKDYYTYYVALKFIPNGKRETIGMKEPLDNFPSEELLGKIIVFS